MKCEYCGHEGVPGDQVRIVPSSRFGDKWMCDSVTRCVDRIKESIKAANLKQEKESGRE